MGETTKGSGSKPQLDIEGAGAPPRRNGELVFQEPWEGRAFGLAVALGDRGLYPWEAFRSRLIAAIAEADRRAYYESWLAALEMVLVERRILTPSEIEERTRQFVTGQRDIVTPGA